MSTQRLNPTKVIYPNKLHPDSQSRKVDVGWQASEKTYTDNHESNTSRVCIRSGPSTRSQNISKEVKDKPKTFDIVIEADDFPDVD